MSGRERGVTDFRCLGSCILVQSVGFSWLKMLWSQSTLESRRDASQPGEQSHQFIMNLQSSQVPFLYIGSFKKKKKPKQTKKRQSTV